MPSQSDCNNDDHRARKILLRRISIIDRYLTCKCMISTKKGLYMKTCYRLMITSLLSCCLLVIAAIPLAAQEKPGNPAYDWLNGKWSGTAPLGRTSSPTSGL